MRLSRCLPDTSILPRQSRTRSGALRFARAIAVMPIIAFMGVRISWDMEERKSVLAEFATRAAW